MPRHVAGIDLGGTRLQGVVIGHRAEPLGRSVAGTPAQGGPRAVTERIAAVVLAGAQSAGVPAEEVAAVRIGSAGQVDMADEPPLRMLPTRLGELAGAIGAALLVHEASP